MVLGLKLQVCKGGCLYSSSDDSAASAGHDLVGDNNRGELGGLGGLGLRVWGLGFGV